MKKELYIVSYEIFGMQYLNRTEVMATSEANAIAQIQAEGHKVNWCCKKDLTPKSIN